MKKAALFATGLLIIVFASPSLWAQDAKERQQLNNDLQKLIQAKDWGGAVKICDELLGVSPLDRKLCYVKACCLARWGKKDEALTFLSQAQKQGFADATKMAQDPDLDSLREEWRFKEILKKVQLSQFAGEYRNQMRQKDWTGALRTCDKLLAISPTNPTFPFIQARCLARMGKKDQTLAALDKAVKLGFKNAEQMAKDPSFASLREEQGFKNALKAIALKAAEANRMVQPRQDTRNVLYWLSALWEESDSQFQPLAGEINKLMDKKDWDGA